MGLHSYISLFGTFYGHLMEENIPWVFMIRVTLYFYIRITMLLPTTYLKKKISKDIIQAHE